MVDFRQWVVVALWGGLLLLLSHSDPEVSPNFFGGFGVSCLLFPVSYSIALGSMSTSTRRIVSVLCLAFLSPACRCPASGARDEAPPVVTLAVVTNLGGTTGPCGCTSKPLGGLARVAAALEKLAVEGPVGLVVVGDTFVEHGDPPGHLFDQERAKSLVIVDILKRLPTLAVLRGSRDLGVLRAAVERRATSLPLFAPAKSAATRERADAAVVNIGGLSVGFLGVPGTAEGHRMSYNARAAVLRRHRAELVVALVPEGGREGRRLAAGFDRIDVAITGGSDRLQPPRVVRGTLVVESADKGQYLGLLRFVRQGQGKWAFNDEGNQERRTLDARSKRLRDELNAFGQGPARQAREQKLAELETRRREFTPPTPKGPYVTWEALPIEQEIEPAAWASALLGDYHRSLCEIAKRATARRDCPQADNPAAQFVGTDQCTECHAEAVRVYQQTAHAQAWQSLKAGSKDCDPTCIGCHSVGYEKPGGYCRLTAAEQFRNVGCESCHGPGHGHAEAPDDKDKRAPWFRRQVPQAVCEQCHTAEHSDLFDYGTYLPRVLGPGHGAP